MSTLSKFFACFSSGGGGRPSLTDGGGSGSSSGSSAAKYKAPPAPTAPLSSGAVVPVTHNVDNAFDPELDKKVFDDPDGAPIKTSVRIKQSAHVPAAAAAPLTLVEKEKECLSLLQMIRVVTVEESSKTVRHPLEDPTKILRYVLDGDKASEGATGAPPAPGVVLSLIKTVLLKTVMRDFLRDLEEKDIKEILTVAEDVLEVIYRGPNWMQTSVVPASRIGLTGLNLEGSLVMLDLLTMTMHDTVLCAAQGYYVHPLTAEWYTVFEQLCATMKSIVVGLPTDMATHPSHNTTAAAADKLSSQRSTQSSTVTSDKLRSNKAPVSINTMSPARTDDMLCQCIGRAAKVLRALGMGCLVTFVFPLPTVDDTTPLSRALYTLAEALIGVRKRSADKTYAVSMMYWGSCDAVLGIVDRISAMNGRLLALDGDSGGNGGALGVVLSSIALSAPGPVELCMEINRLMFMKQSVGPSLPMTTLNLPAVAGLTPAMADAAAAAAAIGGATSAGDAMAWTGSVAALNNLIIHSSKGNALSELLNADSIRLYYLLYGLQRALRAGILECRDHRSNLALREQWMNAIADALLYVLDQDWRSSPYGMNHEDFRSRSGAGDTSRMNSARLSSRNDTTRSSDSASRGGALGSARSGGPLSARAAGARGAETGSRSTHGAGGAVRYNMLVVDDSHMNRKMILKALLKEGHVCEEAEDGLQAIAKVLEKQTTPSTLYDGILMDFVMPNMDGPTATKALRAMGYNGVILGVTGNQLSFDIEHFVECGANKVLMKPLKMDEFRQSMELGNVNTTSGQSTRAQKKKRASVSKGQNAAVLGEDEAVEQAAVSYEVLIVDDSGTNRKMLRRMMTSAGHQCDEAEDGLQAIMKAKQKIEQSGLSKRSYDVVLMDYVMPNMDGPTTTKALRAMGYEGVVIGITGNNVDFDHFMNCGANRVIEKPLKIEMFVDVMDTFDKKQRQEKAKRAGIAEDDGSGPGSMVVTSRNGRRDSRGVGGGGGGDLADFVNADNSSFKLLSLAPVLAEMLLEVAVGFASSTGPDWVFWELTVRLAGFIQRSRKGKAATRSLYRRLTRSSHSHAGSVSATPRIGSFMLHTAVGIAPVASTDGADGEQRNEFLDQIIAAGNAMSGLGIDLGLTRSPTVTVKSTPHSSTKSAPKTAAVGIAEVAAEISPLMLEAAPPTKKPVEIFAVDDLVDGLVQMPGGAPRWYPGRISKVNESGADGERTYTIAYHDGDVHDNKPPDEVRKTKSRRPPPAVPAVKALTPATAAPAPAPAPAPAEVKKPDAFVVGDLVDGQVTTSSGAVRWYPGRISTVNESGADGKRTYTIAYHDGDVGENKPEDEVRKSKSRIKPEDVPKKPLFAVGDLVDGQVTTSSGATRWYPGRVTAVTGTPGKHSYTIAYHDGDVGENKPEADVRKTKSRIRPEDIPKKPLFAVGDLVDGQVTTSSGATRWYPGRVTAVNTVAGKHTYTIAYHDGDMGENKPEGEVRKTKSRIRPEDVPKREVRSKDVGATPAAGRGDDDVSLSLSADSGASPTASPFALVSVTKKLDLGGGGGGSGGGESGSGSGAKRPSSAGSDDSAGTDDSDDGIFCIPSVYGVARYEKKNDLFKMKLNNINITSAANEPGGGSLSGMLLRESVDAPMGDVMAALDGGGDGHESDHELDDDTDKSIVSALFNELVPGAADDDDSAHPDGDTLAPPPVVVPVVASPFSPAPSWLAGAKGGPKKDYSPPASRPGTAGAIKPLTMADIPRGGPTRLPGTVDTGLSLGALPRAGGAAGAAGADVAPRALPVLKFPSTVPSLGLGGLGGLAVAAPDLVPHAASLHKAASASTDAAEPAVPPSEEEIKSSLTTAFSMVAGMSEETNEVLVRAFSIITALLLRRAVVGGGLFLDPTTVRPKTLGGHRKVEGAAAAAAAAEDDKDRALAVMGTSRSTATAMTGRTDLTDEASKDSGAGAAAAAAAGNTAASSVQINMIFTVREFLELLPDVHLRGKIIPQLVQLSNISQGAGMRVLKLLSGGAFHSCLPTHVSEAEKIGDGGFGSVFKFKCDPRQCKRPYHCTATTTGALCRMVRKPDSDALSPHLAPQTFAVKRLARERSGFDNPLIYDIFNEITALELLAGRGVDGICKLVDYGVSGNEYWFVMEAGTMDLVGWRKKLRGRPGDSESSVALAAAGDDDDPDAVPPLSEETLALCLGLYVDCLLIVQSVHQAHVLHFDLKCNNFILRVPAGQALDHTAIRRAHLQGKPSGILFLADFGEAVPLPAPVRRGGSAEATELARADAAGGPSTRSRSRGTLPIQSPEMICLNFGSEGGGGGGGGGGSEAVTPAKAGGGGGGGGTQRKVFPAPGCPSDVWSLGCMLGELATGRFLLADRPWTDLYVSLCMHKYVAPPLDTLRAAVRQAHPQVADRVCAMVARALHQDPSSRARLVDLYEEAMRILLDYHLLEASGTPVAQSRHTSLTNPGGAAAAGAATGATPASMKKGASLQSLGTKLLERSWKVADWAHERCLLCPAVVDLWCPVGASPDVRLLVALLGPDGDLTGQGEPRGGDNDTSEKDGGGELPPRPLDVDSVTAPFVSAPTRSCLARPARRRRRGDAGASFRGEMSASSRMASVRTISTSRSSARASTAAGFTSVSRDGEDARDWLQDELVGVADHIASASLQTCARFATGKALLDAVWARSRADGGGDGGVLHIDVSSAEDVDEILVGAAEEAPGEGRRRRLKIVLPMQEGEPHVSDAAVVAALRSACAAATDALRATATAGGGDGAPPLRTLTVLITVTPLARVFDLDGAPVTEGSVGGESTPKRASDLGSAANSESNTPRPGDDANAGMLPYSSPAVTLAVALAERLAALDTETTPASAGPAATTTTNTVNGDGAGHGPGLRTSDKADGAFVSYPAGPDGDLDVFEQQDLANRADRDQLRGVVSKQYLSEEAPPPPLARAWQLHHSTYISRGPLAVAPWIQTATHTEFRDFLEKNLQWQ